MPPAVRFTITGFGPFGGVDVNPTQALLEEAEEGGRALLASALPPDLAARVHSTAILPVSAAAATAWAAAEAEALTADDASFTVALHLGVDASPGGPASRGTFALEAAGYNSCAFRIPDADGVCLEGCPVEAGRPQGEARTTRLPLERVVGRLVAAGAAVEGTSSSPSLPAVRVSTCPGRFLCNQLYYLSLGLSQRQQRRTALFVHVPPAEVVGLGAQAAFLAALLGAIVAEVEGREGV